jgi:hypothetical protein
MTKGQRQKFHFTLLSWGSLIEFIFITLLKAFITQFFITQHVSHDYRPDCPCADRCPAKFYLSCMAFFRKYLIQAERWVISSNK